MNLPPRPATAVLALGIVLGACGSDGDSSAEPAGQVASVEPTASSTSLPDASLPADSHSSDREDTNAVETVERPESAWVEHDFPSLAPAPASGDIRDVDFRNGLMFPNHIGEGDGGLHGPINDGEFFNGEWGDLEFYAFYVHEPVFADLDSDGTEEAVMSAAWNGGGSGYFSELRALSIEGDDVVEVGIQFYGDRAFGGIAKVRPSPYGNAVLVDTFIEGDGACCAHTIQQQRVGWADGQLSVIESSDQVRYLYLPNLDDDSELTFIPGTNEALLGLADGSENSVRFDARAGQVVQLTDHAGPATSTRRLTHIATGETVDAEGETVLEQDGLFELSITTDPAGNVDNDVPVWTAVSFSIFDQDDLRTPGLAEFAHLVETEDINTDTGTEPVVDVLVPEFPDQPNVEAAIGEFVDSQVDPWILHTEELDSSDSDVADVFELTSEVTLNSPILVSIKFEFYEYACCRAHPNFGYRGLTVEPETGRVLTDGDIVDLSRRNEITQIFFDALTAKGQLGDDFDPAVAFPTHLDFQAWSSISVAPDGLIFGTDRTGPFPSTDTFVPFIDLGDLVFPEIVEAAT